MGALFDTPHLGTFKNPVFYYTVVDAEKLALIKKVATYYHINFERWVIINTSRLTETIHLSLELGIIFYSPQYNCIRSTFDNTQNLLKFDDFIQIIINDHRV